jgi:hypothetical protein
MTATRLINKHVLEVYCMVGNTPWAVWNVPDNEQMRRGQPKVSSGLHPGDVLTMVTNTDWTIIGVVLQSQLAKVPGMGKGAKGGKFGNGSGSLQPAHNAREAIAPGCESARIHNFRVVIISVFNPDNQHKRMSDIQMKNICFVKNVSKTTGIVTPRMFWNILSMQPWQIELLAGQVGSLPTLHLPFQRTPERPWAALLN